MTLSDDEKYIISAEEVAVYEIWARTKEEAKELWEQGEGDFLGYDDSREKVILVERFDPRG